MICIFQIVLMHFFREQGNAISDKQMSYVLREQLVNAIVQKLLVYLIVIR